jgi:hypothetical protein
LEEIICTQIVVDVSQTYRPEEKALISECEMSFYNIAGGKIQSY